MSSSLPVVLITGANTGLGYQIVRGLCKSQKQQYTILLGGRSITKAEDAASTASAEFPSAKENIHPVQIDIEDDKSIGDLYNVVEQKYGRLDCLINNAGTWQPSSSKYPDTTNNVTIGTQLDPIYREGRMSLRELWDKSWSVNVASTQVMTHTFVPLLLKSKDARLMFMASGTSSLTIAENRALPINKAPEAGWPKKMAHVNDIAAYRSSKAGMNMMMRYVHFPTP